MNGEPEPDIGRLIRAIADGAPVDWTLIGDRSASASLHRILSALRVVSQIGEVHCGILAESSEPLTESGAPEADSDVSLSQWGPLSLVERVGHGSYGEVYRAWDPRLEREVALKLLHRIPGLDSRPDTAVIKEARLLARVHHAHVATVHGADHVDGRTGFWMEFVTGRDLERVVRDDGPLSVGRVRQIGIQLCSAVSAVHNAGLLHRDIKAQNVMLENGGRAVLMDFGAGRAMKDEAPRELVGTPLYVAPEVLVGEPPTVRSDVYSIGVLLFFLLTGAYPVVARTIDDLRDRHAESNRARLRDLRAHIPHRLAATIERALEVDPARRFASADALAVALRDAVPPRIVRGFVTGAALALVATLAAFGTVKSGYTSSRRFQFKPHDRVLVTTFDDLTESSLPRGAIEFAFERELWNSDYLDTVPPQQVRDALRWIGRASDGRVDIPLARGVSERLHDVSALIAGRVTNVGTQYRLSVRIVNPSDGSTVASFDEEAPQSRLMAAIANGARRVRKRLGDDTPPVRLDTLQSAPSLLALHAYSSALQLVEGDPPWKLQQAEALLTQAIKDSPDFAPLELVLAWIVHDEYPAGDFVSHINRALSLRETANTFERRFIDASYHSLIADTLPNSLSLSERRRAIADWELVLRARPNDAWATRLVLLQHGYLGATQESADGLGRLSDACPTNLPILLVTARRFIEVGDLRRARWVRQRAEAVLSAMSTLENVDVSFQVDFLKVREAFSERDAVRAGRLLDDIAERAAAQPMTESAIRTIRTGLVNGNLDLGRYREAGHFAEQSPPVLRETLNMIVILTRFTVSDPPERAAARRFWSTRLMDLPTALKLQKTNYASIPGYIDNLIYAGEFDEVRKAVVWARRNDREGPRQFRFDVEGQLALIDGRTDDALRLFTDARAAGAPIGYDLRMAGSLAGVYRARGMPSEAIHVILDASKRAWSVCPMRTEIGPPCVAVWFRNQDLLSELYSQTGRLEDSRAVDAELSQVLAVANDDDPIVRHIRQRRTARRD